MTFRFPYTAYVHSWSAGVADGYNEAADSYLPALGSTGTAVRAFWATPHTFEPPLAGHDRVVVDIELYVPKGTVIGPHDVVDVNGKAYEVIGEPEDWNYGPFGFGDCPLRVKLRRVDG